MFVMVWIICLAIFRIRNNTWPWTFLKASLLATAFWAGFFLIAEYWP